MLGFEDNECSYRPELTAEFHRSHLVPCSFLFSNFQEETSLLFARLESGDISPHNFKIGNKKCSLLHN